MHASLHQDVSIGRRFYRILGLDFLGTTLSAFQLPIPVASWRWNDAVIPTSLASRLSIRRIKGTEGILSHFSQVSLTSILATTSEFCCALMAVEKYKAQRRTLLEEPYHRVLNKYIKLGST